MYKIGDNVVYGANGVMTVFDIREETITDAARTYYVLGSPSGRQDSLTFVPVDNENLVKCIRPLMSVDEVNALIADIPSITEHEWIQDNRRRADSFKAVIESADQRRIIGVMKAIHSTGERRIAEGKKNYLSDEGVLRKAEFVLHSELAMVLGIDLSEVGDYIKSHSEIK